MPHVQKQLDLCLQCDCPTWCWITAKGPICGACRAENFFVWLYSYVGFRLLDWQREEIRAIYGPVDVETGRRRIRRAYEELPKKNGKSFWAGGLPIFHLIVEADDMLAPPAAFGAAAAKDQASLVFAAARQLVMANPVLKDKLKVLPSTKRIIRRDGFGSYVVLSADGDLQDGVEPSLAIIDELHRWRTQKAKTLHDILVAGTISREEPLVLEITTAGDVYESPLCWDMHERARQKIAGLIPADDFHARIFAIDPQKFRDDPGYWKTREARREANPSHEDRGGFLKDSAIQSMEHELGEPAYKRYHLNIWNQKAEKLFPMDAWTRCSGETRTLMNRPCWLGLDLSKTTDLTALVAVFPDEDRTLDVLPFFWLPADRVHQVEKNVKVNLKYWVNKGLIQTTPGPVLDYEVVRAKIRWMRETFRVQEICYDPWNATQFVQQLIDDGFTCVEIRQGPPTLSAPLKWLIDRILLGELRHGGNEVLAWNADCTTARVDANGNIAPQKERLEREGKRIDGISALLNACYRVMLANSEDPYSKGAKLWAV